jgi:uncharacterized protein
MEAIKASPAHAIYKQMGHYSGVGGRSFTRGTAFTATVIADSAPMADTAATALANASFIDDPAVIRCPADEIDPDTDIPGLVVTVRVRDLKQSTRHVGLGRALPFSERLIDRG